MAANRAVQRVTTAVARRPAVGTTQRSAVAVAPSPARALQQRLGNHGAQRFGAQVVARSSAPGGSVGGGTSAGTFSLSAPDDASEREADRVADAVMRTTERGSASPSPSALTVQRACADCEEEMSKRARAAQPVAAGDAPEVHRSASSAEASQVSAPVAASIHDMQGGGAPLADATRALFEPRFGADFSRVRVHTDAHAARTASSINAKAFTVGRDVAFAAGKYAPHSGEGQRLLAHELTHVIQQSGTSASTVQRDDEPGAQPGRDEPEDKPLFVPEAVVLELLHLLELEAFAGSAEEFEEEPAAAPSDAEQLFQEALDDATAWLGHGASADRKILLLRTEDVRLQKNAAYKETVIGQFATEQYPDQQYLAWLMDTYDPISSTEQGTLSRLNENMQLALTPSSFIDNLEIQRWEGANAFPDYAWNIVQPLISPSEGLRTSVASSRSATETRLIASWGALGLDLAAHGIPASYMRSLSISHYSAVKSKAVPKLLKMPDRAWIYEHFVLPEETALHSAVMKEYTENLTSYVLASLQHSVLEKWAAASAFRWPYFDTYAISVFRNTYTSGLGSVEDFYNYAQIGLGQAAAVTAAGLEAQIPSSGANPFLVLIRLSAEAQGLGPKIITQLNAAELQNFKNTLEHADSKLAKLPEASRLMTAVDWSIKKGFAGEGILALLDNLDTILLELLKDFAKEKAVKKAISAIGVFGGPWGRAISLLYNIWELLDDVRDKVEMALLIKSFLDIVDMAKQSETIVTTQQASAKLAQAYASTFQILIQRLGAKLLAKLSAKAAKRLGEKWKKGDRMSDAEQAENIAVSQKVDDARNLEPQYLHAEVKTALKAPARKSSDADYDAEVAVGNNHVYRRLRGTNIWCRSTDKCVVPKLDPELTKELNDKADKEVPSAQSGESQKPVAAFEPGKAPKSPEQITEFLAKSGLSPAEIIGFGGADAQKLGKADAARVAALSEHFTAADLKALGSYLFNNSKVLTDRRVTSLITNVRPGGMDDFLSVGKNPEIGKEHGEQIIDIEGGTGIRTVPAQTRTKATQPGLEPLWKIAEQQLLPVLETKLGKGWDISPRVQNPNAKKGETLGSTVPEYYRREPKPAQAFEVKRFNLQEMGISQEGRIVANPSKDTVDALVRARAQLATREMNLEEGTQQNIVFNITGQGAADAKLTGTQIKEILKKNHIKYGKVWVQDGNELIEID